MDKYYFSSRYVSAQVSGGALLNIQPGPAQAGLRETQYVLSGHPFGAVDVLWVKGEETGKIGSDSEWKSSPPEVKGLGGCYQAFIEGEPIKIEMGLCFDGESMIQTIQMTNIVNEAVTLTNVSYRFYANTDFAFGKSIGDKVIGHHFISGHGSHLMFIRCDGQGPFLMVLPQNGTSLEYFEMDSDAKSPGAYRAYALSSEAVKKVGESKMPTPGSSHILQPGEKLVHTFKYMWATDNDQARKRIIESGLIDIDVAPGLTVPAGNLITMKVTSIWDDMEMDWPIISRNGDLIEFKLENLGENTLTIRYDQGRRWMNIVFFVTQDLKTIINKRGAFIASKQHTDPSKWYHGLLAEHNNRTGTLLGPDNYDDIGGWRIYEVTCDDPGLSKPAFLSLKLAEYPVKEEVAALDLYVEKFVWGGLQCTEEEAYPYGIYGIPDWKQNRDSEHEDTRGKLHIWRIYDYPHIALTYFNMYRIAKNYPDMPLTHDAKTYLIRARETAIAMFAIPMDLIRWDARNTGLYNELCYEDIIEALKTEGLPFDRLQRHWDRKSHYFATECTDLFGSEYPFDTTGFESTHVLARHALELAENEIKEKQYRPPITREQAVRFMENQLACNIATRGILEPTYYWYGSDYRSNNTSYTLSYMSQMGGYAILDYALYYAQDPFWLIRLGYGSLLSSWALLNTGYWFPGEEHDGAACGGFEPMATSKTWLGQDLNGGPWYYSCEIDLGFCGGLRGAATIVVKDPEFGLISYGGNLKGNSVTCEDGVQRRFHIVTPQGRIHIQIDKGRFNGGFAWDNGRLTFKVDPCGAYGDISLKVSSSGYGDFKAGDAQGTDGKELLIIIPNEVQEVELTWDTSLI
ncbi:MAG: DUF5695 domain-containing protein [Defluviitaleaceae bacterium]|nr:DUF5695 domain-containing protein [Defluviitaleaceae bacterium]